MMMKTKYSDENDVVVVRTPWNRLAHDLRDPTAFSPRSRLDRRTLAFVLIIGDHGDHSTMSGVSTTFLPRLYHAYLLMAILARSGPIFRHRRRAVRTPNRCDGGITQVQTRLPKTKHVWPMKINVICTDVCTIPVNKVRSLLL